MTKYLLIPVLLLLCIPALAQKPEEGIGSGIIYGTNPAYSLSAPKGWVMDNQAGVSQSIFAVFYPHGASWGDGSVVMYTNVIQKRDDKQTLAEVIAAEQADTKQHSPGLKITDAPALPTRKDNTATVKYLTGDADGNFEAIAYINEPKLVVLLVLSARNKTDFDKSLPAFAELVKSYFFISDNVVIGK
jgi:hypothetical protein